MNDSPVWTGFKGADEFSVALGLLWGVRKQTVNVFDEVRREFGFGVSGVGVPRPKPWLRRSIKPFRKRGNNPNQDEKEAENPRFLKPILWLLSPHEPDRGCQP